MPDIRINAYEGMFLFPQASTANLQEAVDHITDILHRAEAEVISLKKWDERRLAFDIKGNKRGVYFLVYFKARATQIANIERDCNYSEKLLRSMITRADHLTVDQMQASDGRQQLADEIKLRASQPQAGAGGEDSAAPVGAPAGAVAGAAAGAAVEA
jgi:small subunit ribosomal protein S6